MKILAFGKIAEILRQSEQDFEGPETVSALRIFLEKEYPELKTLRYVIAVNKQTVNEHTQLFEGDEVALLPPFSGG